MVTDNENSKINYFLPGPSVENYKRANTDIIQQLQRDFIDVFTGVGSFDGSFSFQVKPDSNGQYMPMRCVVYALQKPFKEELDELQQQDIITPLGVDETAEWYNSFILISKPNGKVRLCLDLARLNQALIRPVHRGPTLNDIFPKLNNEKYFSLIELKFWISHPTTR